MVFFILTEVRKTWEFAVGPPAVSPAWWRQKIFRKKIRYLKIGRKILIPQSTIDEILKEAVVEPRKINSSIRIR